MRSYSADLREILAHGSFDVEWVADVYYDGSRRLTNLPIVDPKLDDNADSKVQGTGSCTVVWTPDFAESLSPTLADDTLAPFGSELSVAVVIRAGSFAERVQMGWYRIEDVPSAADQFVSFGDQLLPVGSKVELALQDRMLRVQRDRIDVPGSPPSRVSVLAEAQRLTGLQIVREVADTSIPKSFAYEEDRLDPLYDLLEFADAIPYMRPDGTLGQRPIDWPQPVDVLTDGEDGTLVSVGYSMSSDKVYNRVAVRSSATGDDKQQVLGSAQITDGPLRAVNLDGSPSPFGRVTYYYSSDYITTKAQANQYARQLLPRVSGMRVAERPVVETFNPLRQVGDVIEVRQQGRAPFTGRISTISRGSDATQQMTLEVQ